MFRNFWYYNRENFQEFKDLVETTWKGMSISASERPDYFTKQLMMFCYENRMPREICWAGFGFQVWLQLLTHIVSSKEADLLVVDEPEIYLHPDLQHKILNILKDINANVVVATHSVELINSIEPSDVLIIDKKNKNSKRISDLQGLQGVSNLLGSGQNIQLTRLARGKKILFVEGKDVKLLSRLAKVYGKEELFTSREITVIPIEGFSQHDKIIYSNWAFKKTLGEELKIAVLLDRDYRASEEIQTVEEKLSNDVDLCHILKRKEIENYFLVPAILTKVIAKKIVERTKELQKTEVTDVDVEKILFQVSESTKTETLSQIIAHKLRIKTHRDTSTTISDATCEFEESWKSLEFRFRTMPGKSFLSLLNDYLQREFKVTVTIHQIANAMHQGNLDADMKLFF